MSEAEVSEWVGKATPDQMESVPDDLPDETSESFTDDLIFSFSGLSGWAGLFGASREKDGSLGVSLRIPAAVQFRDVGKDPYYSTESRWPELRSQLKHIFEALCAVYPVRSSSVDGPLA